MSTKYKKHSIEDRIKYIKMLEEGYSIDYICNHYGFDHHLLSILWMKYQKEGPLALMKKRNIRADGAFKEAVLREIEVPSKGAIISIFSFVILTFAFDALSFASRWSDTGHMAPKAGSRGGLGANIGNKTGLEDRKRKNVAKCFWLLKRKMCKKEVAARWKGFSHFCFVLSDFMPKFAGFCAGRSREV